MSEPVDILLVDDEPRNLDMLEAILSEPDYRLLRAEDADSALRLLLDHDVAAIVLDIQMPSMTGFELAKIIKTTKRFRETPVVFLTAFLLDDRDVAAGYGAGAVDYLTKPFNPQILQQKIAVFADLFRKTRALSVLNATLEERVRERTLELEKSEAQLREAGAQKDEFLAVLAHVLRNPLAPLRMGVDLLLGQRAGQGVFRRAGERVNCRKGHHVVDRIDGHGEACCRGQGAITHGDGDGCGAVLVGGRRDHQGTIRACTAEHDRGVWHQSGIAGKRG